MAIREYCSFRCCESVLTGCLLVFIHKRQFDATANICAVQMHATLSQHANFLIKPVNSSCANHTIQLTILVDNLLGALI